MDALKIRLKLKKWYDKVSMKYDTWGTRKNEFDVGSFDKEFENFKKLTNIKKNDIVLDIATGTGIYLFEMVKICKKGYGIDISKKMLNTLELKAKKLNIEWKLEVKQGSAEKIPYPNGFFDWVTCIGMFEYYPIEYVKKCLKEINRVLKSRGKVIIDFPDKKDSKIMKFKSKEESIGHKLFLYDKTFLIETIRTQGFQIKKIKKTGIEIQFLLSKNK